MNEEQSQEDMNIVKDMYPIQAQAAALDSLRLKEQARLAALDLQVALLIAPKPTLVHEAHWEPIEQFPWQCVPSYDEHDECNWIPLPFSSSICHAWELVKIAAKDGYNTDLAIGMGDEPPCLCVLHRLVMTENIDDGVRQEGCKRLGDTAPEAIVKAFIALKESKR